MGRDQALAVDQMLGYAAFQSTGALARIVGLITFLVGTTAVFVQLQDSLNHMWDVAPKPGPLIKTLLLKRLISFALVLAVGFVLLVSLVSRRRCTRSRSWSRASWQLPPPYSRAETWS